MQYYFVLFLYIFNSQIVSQMASWGSQRISVQRSPWNWSLHLQQAVPPEGAHLSSSALQCLWQRHFQFWICSALRNWQESPCRWQAYRLCLCHLCKPLFSLCWQIFFWVPGFSNPRNPSRQCGWIRNRIKLITWILGYHSWILCYHSWAYLSILYLPNKQQ